MHERRTAHKHVMPAQKRLYPARLDQHRYGTHRPRCLLTTSRHFTIRWDGLHRRFDQKKGLFQSQNDQRQALDRKHLELL